MRNFQHSLLLSVFLLFLDCGRYFCGGIKIILKIIYNIHKDLKLTLTFLLLILLLYYLFPTIFSYILIRFPGLNIFYIWSDKKLSVTSQLDYRHCIMIRVTPFLRDIKTGSTFRRSFNDIMMYDIHRSHFESAPSQGTYDLYWFEMSLRSARNWKDEVLLVSTSTLLYITEYQFVPDIKNCKFIGRIFDFIVKVPHNRLGCSKHFL